MVGAQDVRVGEGIQDQGDHLDPVACQGTVVIEAGQRQELLDQRGHARPLGGDPLERLAPGCLVNVATGQLRIPLHGRERGAQLVGGIGDELAELRLAACPALHAVFDGVNHRVEGTCHLGDLDGAGHRRVAHTRQRLRVIGQVSPRNVGGGLAHD